MNKVPGEVLAEGFLVKHCPNALPSETLDKPWKPRYFILKGKHLLYWKKRNHALSSPNDPHSLIDLDGSTVEKVSLVEGRAPPFPYCVRVTTALLHQGTFLTYHFSVQEEEAFRTWFAALRKAAGQPELPPSPPILTKHHTRSLSTGGGLGAIQRQPITPNSPSNSLSSSPVAAGPGLSPRVSSYTASLNKPGLDTIRSFQPIVPSATPTETAVEEESSSTGVEAAPKETESSTTSSDSSGGDSSTPPAPSEAESSSPRDSTSTTPSSDAPSSTSSSETSPQEPSSTAIEGESSTATSPEPSATSEPTPTPTTTESATTTTESSSTPSAPLTKKEEIMNEVAKARMRVMQLEKSNKLVLPSTVASRFPAKLPPPEPTPGLFTTRNGIILLFLLILYWYFF